jgi:hypothetical protein
MDLVVAVHAGDALGSFRRSGGEPCKCVERSGETALVRRAVARDTFKSLALAERGCLAGLGVAPGGSFAYLFDCSFVFGGLGRGP